MKTHEEVMVLANQIQEKSSSNVNVSVDFSLGGLGLNWCVHLLVLNPQGGVANYIGLSPHDNPSWLEFLAKYGYNSKLAALNSNGIPRIGIKTLAANIWDWESELKIKDGVILNK